MTKSLFSSQASYIVEGLKFVPKILRAQRVGPVQFDRAMTYGGALLGSNCSMLHGAQNIIKSRRDKGNTL
jgi:hypothetical protein